VAEARQVSILDSAVRRQLEKILAHHLFARSERMGRFLRLATEWTLEGKAEELKEYLIGVEVFDRKSSYDPRVDPIVRVEARRLRAKLKAYYEGDGVSDPVVIEFTKGSYAPGIRAAAKAPAPAPLPTGPALATTAVLPFVNLSQVPESEYFSDGLTEELIHALTKVPGMRVVAWTTAAQYRDRQQDIFAIRERLKVGTVLTGTVRMTESNLRVRAQLIDTETGVYLWSENFDREVQDIFAIQEEIARAIVRTLRVQLAGGREQAPMGRRRSSVDSYNWYLRGRYLCHRRTPDHLKQSLSCFRNAVDADPSSALAHAGLSDAYSLQVDYGLLSPAEGMPRAKAAAERAIALDPELAEPHTSLAFVRGLYEWEWEDAERLYRRSIELNPGYALAHHWLAADHCLPLGQLDEALAEIRIAIELDPLSSIILEGLGYILTLRGEYEPAIAAFSEILTVDPSFYKACTSMGRYQEALVMLEKGRALAGDIPNILAATAQICAQAGDRPRARGLLGELERLAAAGHVPATCFALAHLGLGEKDRALDWLEKGLEWRDASMPVVKIHPIYDDLRAEPRFHAVLKRMRLA